MADNDRSLMEEEVVSGEDVDIEICDESEEEEEGEGEEERDDKNFEEKPNELPCKVKNTIFNLFGMLKKKKNRNQFKKMLGKELKVHENLYSNSYGVALAGSEKLIEAGREFLNTLDISVKVTKEAIERVKKLRKYSSEVNDIEKRIENLKQFFDEKVGDENNNNNNANTEVNSDDLLYLFTEINQIKESLETLLEEISKFRKGVEIRRKVLKGLIAGSAGTSALLLGGGFSIAIMGGVAGLGTLATSGLSAPVALALLSLSGIGVVTGVGASGISYCGIMVLLAASSIENLSYGFTKRKIKKVKKQVVCLKKGKQRKLWNDVMEFVEKRKKIKEKSE